MNIQLDNFKVLTYGALILVLVVSVGCVPLVTNYYTLTTPDSPRKETSDELWIKVESAVDMHLSGGCNNPYEGTCLIQIRLFYPENIEVDFIEGHFVIHDIRDRSIVYRKSLYVPGWGYRYDRKEDEKKELRWNIWLSKDIPSKFALQIPLLNINGNNHELPVIHVRSIRGPMLAPILVNY